MTLKSIFLLLLLAGSANAAEIRGTIKFADSPKGQIEVSYAGLTTRGEEITNMAGVTIGSFAASAWCDTYKPRRTGVQWDPESGLTFEHLELPVGRYVVAVKYMGFLDWKVVELKANRSAADVAFALDLRQVGSLRVVIGRAAGDYQVEAVPITAEGKSLVAGLDLANSFHVRLAVDVSKGQPASFERLKAGYYRVIVSGVRRISTEANGWSAALTEIGSVNATVESGKQTIVRLP